MGRRLLAVLAKALAWFLLFQAVFRIVKKRYPIPCPYGAAFLMESRLRRWLLPPERTLAAVGIEPGMHVLELGSGPGYLTPEAARRAGPEGRVYAVDIQPGMVARVREKVERLGLTNVETRVAGAYDLPFPDDSLDLAFLVAVLGEIPDRPRALRELHRVLCPGGRLSIVELLPDPDYSLPSTVRRLAEDAGFRHEETAGSLHFYTANFRKE